MLEQFNNVKGKIAPVSDSGKGGHGVVENRRNCGPDCECGGRGYRFSYRWIPEGEDGGDTQNVGGLT
jgi:hypothetical protein